MKKSLVCSLAMLFLLMFWAGAASASQYTMEVIGTAQFVGATGSNDPEYNLILDPDNNGKSLVWLDYTNGTNNWQNQKAWASGLDSALTINLNAGYSVNWDGSWRLPSTVDGPSVYGYDGTTTRGWNITSSEMGHLYYTELGNNGYYATDGTAQTGWGLNNTGDFDNLIASWYWSGTEYANEPIRAWHFNMGDGGQSNSLEYKSNLKYGLAVRTGDVSVVPVPGALLLLSSGLLGIAGVSRRRNK